jgi:hypothetical protein
MVSIKLEENLTLVLEPIHGEYKLNENRKYVLE